MPTKSHLERELKLAVPDSFSLPDLSSLGPGLLITAFEPASHTAVYYDTADLRLSRWDCGLRYRSSDGWTLKLGDVGSGRAVERREFRLAGEPGEPPSAALDLVAAFIRGADLAPVARLRSERRRVEIATRSRVPLVEVADDQVSIVEGRVPGISFREVEVEISEACPPLLVEEILGRLRRAGAGPAHRVAKHARALGLASGVEPEVPIPAVDGHSSTLDALRRALSKPAGLLVRSDPGVRAGEGPEDVHRMRVATRRLRSHLRTFRPLLDPAWASGLAVELRELAAVLGAVRDADVLGARFEAIAIEKLGPEAEAAKELLKRLSEARRLDRARLLAWLRSERHAALIDRVIAAAREPALRCDPGAPAAVTLAPLVWRRWKRLRRAVTRLGRRPSDRELHRVRIAAKHARYAAEATAPVFGRPVERLALSARPLQEILGDHQDAVVSGAWLREEASGLDSEAAFGAGRLAVREEQARREALRAWRPAWRRARRRARRAARVLRR